MERVSRSCTLSCTPWSRQSLNKSCGRTSVLPCLPRKPPSSACCPLPANMKKCPPYIGNPSTSSRTSHLQSRVDDSYLPRGRGGFLALTLARATLSQLAGGITFLLVLSPVRSPIFTAMSPFLSPGGSRLVRAESLDFCPNIMPL